MAPRYHRVGQPGSASESARPGFFQSISRRPQRLIPIALGFFLLISFTTWLGFTDTGAETAQKWTSSAKAAGAKAGQYWQDHRPTNFGGSTTGNYKTPHGEISPAAALYEFNPGPVPASYDELLKWGEKGDDGNVYPPAFIPSAANKAPRAKAGFITLVRNSELEDLQKSMFEVEYRFNRKYNYPWIFLNDKEFTDEFKAGVRKMTRAEIRFGLVPKEHWGYPDWIDQKKAAETREKMKVSGSRAIDVLQVDFVRRLAHAALPFPRDSL